jgi:hypothetical protein
MGCVESGGMESRQAEEEELIDIPRNGGGECQKLGRTGDILHPGDHSFVEIRILDGSGGGWHVLNSITGRPILSFLSF